MPLAISIETSGSPGTILVGLIAMMMGAGLVSWGSKLAKTDPANRRGNIPKSFSLAFYAEHPRFTIALGIISLVLGFLFVGLGIYGLLVG